MWRPSPGRWRIRGGDVDPIALNQELARGDASATITISNITRPTGDIGAIIGTWQVLPYSFADDDGSYALLAGLTDWTIGASTDAVVLYKCIYIFWSNVDEDGTVVDDFDLNYVFLKSSGSSSTNVQDYSDTAKVRNASTTLTIIHHPLPTAGS